jgi:MFS family permease
MLVAFFSTIAPMVGGLMADFFTGHQLKWTLHIRGVNIHLLNLQGWNYFFIIGGLLAVISLRLLAKIKEEGETNKYKVVTHMRATVRHRLRKNIGREVTDNLYAPSLAMRRKIRLIMKNNRQRMRYRQSA